MELPKALKVKQAMLNLEGVLDGRCFKYSILATIYRNRFVQGKQALARKYKCFLGNINFENISEPTNTKEDTHKFE